MPSKASQTPFKIGTEAGNKTTMTIKKIKFFFKAWKIEYTNNTAKATETNG